jgi:hypothetical protein
LMNCDCLEGGDWDWPLTVLKRRIPIPQMAKIDRGIKKRN